jgi:uncharacterized protein (DUF302 family)
VKELPYGLSVDLALPLGPAISATKEALKAEGFGVLTEIDVKKTLKEKIGSDFQPYVILGACNPSLAFVALQDDIDTGLLLPCNVTVREEADGRSIVTVLDPNVMARVSPSTEMKEVARLARQKLERVLDKLSRQLVN